MNENIVTGKKYRILKDAQADAWDTVSFWKKSCDGELENGKTVEEGLSELGELLDHVTGVGVILNVNTTTESFNGLTVTASNAAEAVTGQFVDGAAKLVLHFIGGYTVSVTDAKGHTFSKSITVAQIGEVLSTTINEVFSTVNITTTSSDIANANIRVSVGGNTVDTIKFTNSSATYKAYDIATYTFTVTSGGSDYSESVSITAMNQTKSVTIDTIKLVPWSTGSDEEIATMINAYYAGKITLAQIKSVWNIGDKRDIYVTGPGSYSIGTTGYAFPPHQANNYSFIIIGFNHDTLSAYIGSKNKALITLHMESVYHYHPYSSSNYNQEYHFMNTNNGYVSSWNDSYNREWCNSAFITSLPSWISALVKTVGKVTTNGKASSTTITSYDKAFLLSEYEVTGTKTNSLAIEGTQYEYYKTISNRYKYFTGTGSSDMTPWWLRSLGDGSTYTKYYTVFTTSCTNSRPIVEYGIAPAFCL